jgi:hypothetical protein
VHPRNPPESEKRARDDKRDWNYPHLQSRRHPADA